MLDFGKLRLKNGKFLKKVYAHKTPLLPRLTFGNCFFQFSDSSCSSSYEKSIPLNEPKSVRNAKMPLVFEERKFQKINQNHKQEEKISSNLS